MRPGGEMTLDHGANGRYRTVFVDVEAPHRLSYRWAEGFPDTRATPDNSTLVEFTIIAVSAHETPLQVVESGFATLVVPAGREWVSFEGHSRGWTDVLAKAAAYAEGRDAAPGWCVASATVASGATSFALRQFSRRRVGSMTWPPRGSTASSPSKRPRSRREPGSLSTVRLGEERRHVTGRHRG